MSTHNNAKGLANADSLRDDSAEEKYQPGSEYVSNDEFGEQLYATRSLGKAYSDREDEEAQLRSNDNNGQSSGSSGSSEEPRKISKTASNNHPLEKVGLLHPKVKQIWPKLIFAYLKIWFIIGALIIPVFSIYWGALYNREGNLHRFEMLVVIEDDALNINNTIGNTMSQLLKTQEIEKLGTWNIIQGNDAVNEYFNNPTNVSEAIFEKIHHRKFWSAIHLLPNATYNTLEAFKGNQDIETSVNFLYQSGRDITAIKPYIVPSLQQIKDSFNAIYPSIAETLVANLTTSQKSDLINNGTLSILPVFEFIDYRPYENSVLLAPLQVGLIYLIIISFFLFNFFVEPHKMLLPHVKIPQYILYRTVGNHLNFLIIALFISTVSAIFQVDFTLAFGKAGFVVYWLTTYLTMAAVGGANENMALLIFVHNPPFLGVWLISFVVLNISPSFSPLAVISPFYRYGYMMPIHNSNEIYKVIFMDLWKGQLGLNYGILVVWVVLNTLLMPFCLKYAGTVMAKRAKEAALTANN